MKTNQDQKVTEFGVMLPIVEYLRRKKKGLCVHCGVNRQDDFHSHSCDDCIAKEEEENS